MTVAGAPAGGSARRRPGNTGKMTTNAPKNRSTGRKSSAGAAREVTDRHSTVLRLPALGEVHLPGADQLAFLGGLGLLAALDILDWPLAVAVGVGHTLVSDRSNRVVREFGEALEEA